MNNTLELQEELIDALKEQTRIQEARIAILEEDLDLAQRGSEAGSRATKVLIEFIFRVRNEMLVGTPQDEVIRQLDAVLDIHRESLEQK